MNKALFGSLIVDHELNIVGFNKDMEALYPAISAGEKCYEVLAEGHKPCAACPIAAKDVHSCANNDKCPYTDIAEVSLTPENKLYMLSFKGAPNAATTAA